MSVLGVTPVFAKRNDATSLSIVCLHLLAVFSPLYLIAIFGVGIQVVFFWIWFGLAMNGLLNLMHECAHLHVFRKRAGSIFLGRWVLAPLALADFDAYQKRHWEHHRKLGEPEDPKYIYHQDIHGFRGIWFLLRCLFLIEAAKKFSMKSDEPGEKSGNLLRWLGRTLIVQAFLGASIFFVSFVFNGPDVSKSAQNALLAYIVYIYGLGSLTVFAASLRAIAEHQIGPEQGTTVNQAALRNFSAGFFGRAILGAYGFADHATHHQEPAIPYYQLKATTTSLASADVSFLPRFSYGSTLLSLMRTVR